MEQSNKECSGGSLFGGSEYMTGGCGCGGVDGGYEGGGLIDDSWTTDFWRKPRIGSVHGILSGLMFLCIILLMLMLPLGGPDSRNGMAIATGVLSFFYILVEVLCVLGGERGPITLALKTPLFEK
jgi:hypothetical protein